MHVVEIGNLLHLDPTLVDYYLDQLTKENYVKVTPTGRFHSRVCNLTPKGRAFAVQNKLLESKPTPSHTSAPETPNEDSHASEIKEYDPDKIATRILLDMERGKFPDSMDALIKELNVTLLDIKDRVNKLIEYRYVDYNELWQTLGVLPYSITTKGKERLDRISTPMLFPNTEPNEIEKNILALLANTDCPPFLDSISTVLKLNPTLVQYHLTELVKRKYLNVDSFNEWYAARYTLTQQARKFLIDNNLIE